MKTRAVRIHGKHDLRLDELELPGMGDDEILARMVADSTCTSSYKAALQGPEHKRVPANVAEHPTILGHEMSGEILEVGEKWKHRFKRGQKFSVQPALNYKGTLDAPGYPFEYFGGEAETCIIPGPVMEMDCLLPYDGPGYFLASLAEPVSCVVGTFRAMYHVPAGTHTHVMGTKLDRAARIYSPQEAEERGVRLVYVNARSTPDIVSELRSLNDGEGYDDVLVFAPVAALVEQADALLARDGCLNFFAGPADKDFTARLNFFNVHYAFTHLVATSGGNGDDASPARTSRRQEALLHRARYAPGRHRRFRGEGKDGSSLPAAR
jgi:threonine dehydrogenase-like Zn-dependent dehydrogenase